MRTLKLLLIAIVALLATTTATAQTAKQVLDKTATKLKSSGGLQASFTATSFNGTTEAGSTNGTICVQGNKFKLTAGNGTTWFNGKTQWSLLKGNDEVYISTPTAAELQSVNPYTFINLYQSGYKLSMKSSTYGGKACYEVTMNAQSKKSSINRMVVLIDKSSYIPQNIRIKQSNGNWVRLRVSSLSTGKQWNSSFFEFSKKDYPQVQLIDLR